MDGVKDGAILKRHRKEVARPVIGDEDILIEHRYVIGGTDAVDIEQKPTLLQGKELELRGSCRNDLTVEQLRIARDYDVKFVVSSDAHKPNQVGSYEAGMARALEVGIELERIVNITERL